MARRAQNEKLVLHAAKLYDNNDDKAAFRLSIALIFVLR